MGRELVPYGRRHSGKGPSERRLEAEQCLTMRTNGKTVLQIATALGISEHTVYRRLDEALSAREIPAVEAYREQQNHALDTLAAELDVHLAALAAVLASEDTPAAVKLNAVAERRKVIESKLRVSERRARLNGLDAPVKVEHSGTVTQVTQADIELQELINEARAAQAVRDKSHYHAPETGA